MGIELFTSMRRRIIFLAILASILVFPVGCSSVPQEDMLSVLDIKIKKHPKDADLYFQRGKLLLDMHRVNESISDLTHAVSLDPKEFKFHMALGDAYFANGDVGHSYSSLQNALQLKPESTEAYLKLGEIAFYSKDYDRAMENLTHVTEKDKDNRTALFMKGFIYKETGDTTNAIVLLRKVCDLYPEYARAFEELGMLYASHHDPLALDYFNTAIQLDPKNTNVLYGVAMYYQEIGQIEKAEETYKQILDINANDKHAWHNRGYIQMFTYEDYELAIDYLSRAIQCDSTFIEAYANRGCAYELIGNTELARQDFVNALNIDHTFEPALEGMKRVSKR